jgi:hypothetical protein
MARYIEEIFHAAMKIHIAQLLAQVGVPWEFRPINIFT